MLKKAGVVAATAAAGLMILAAPAFAGTPGGEGHEGHHHHGGAGQIGLVNVDHFTVDLLNNNNISVPICVPDLDPAVAGIGGAVTAHEIPISPAIPLNVLSEAGDSTTTTTVSHVGCAQHADLSTSGDHVNGNH